MTGSSAASQLWCSNSWQRQRLTRRDRVRRQLGLEVLADVFDQAGIPPKTLGDLRLRHFVSLALLLRLVLVSTRNEAFELNRADEGHKVGDENLLLVLVTSDERDVLADGRVAGQVRVDFAELDPEATDLDLIVGATGALDGPVRVVSTEVARPVHPVADPVPPRLPRRFGIRHLRDRVDALDTLAEPVLDEFLARRIRQLQVTLGETARTNVDLADFADRADLVLVGPVDDEKLHVDHALASRHDVFARLQECRVL